MAPLRAGVGTFRIYDPSEKVAGRSPGQFPHASLHDYLSPFIYPYFSLQVTHFFAFLVIERQTIFHLDFHLIFTLL